MVRPCLKWAGLELGQPMTTTKFYRDSFASSRRCRTHPILSMLNFYPHIYIYIYNLFLTLLLCYKFITESRSMVHEPKPSFDVRHMHP